MKHSNAPTSHVAILRVGNDMLEKKVKAEEIFAHLKIAFTIGKLTKLQRIRFEKLWNAARRSLPREESAAVKTGNEMLAEYDISKPKSKVSPQVQVQPILTKQALILAEQERHAAARLRAFRKTNIAVLAAQQGMPKDVCNSIAITLKTRPFNEEGAQSLEEYVCEILNGVWRIASCNVHFAIAAKNLVKDLWYQGIISLDTVTLWLVRHRLNI